MLDPDLVGAALAEQSAKIIVWRFDGRMAFVPEGQADSSQARSAWVGMQKPRPPMVEVMVSPTDICRRN